MEGRVHTCHVTAPSGLFHLLTLLTELLLSAGACYINGIASREVQFCLRWAFFFSGKLAYFLYINAQG